MKKYFSYDPEGIGFYFHETAEQARSFANAVISFYCAGDCDETVGRVCWGVIIESVQLSNADHVDVPDSDPDYSCNYKLMPVDNGVIGPKFSINAGLSTTPEHLANLCIDPEHLKKLTLFWPENNLIHQMALAQLSSLERITDLSAKLSRYSMSAGEADQRRCESRAVREALGFGRDADNVAPIDLRERIDEMKSIASNSSSTVYELPHLDDELIVILGRPNFMCSSLAEYLRLRGQEIKRKAEHEQAAVLYALLNLYLKYGSEWRFHCKEIFGPTNE